MLRRLLHLRAREGRSRRRGEEDVLLRDVRVRDLFRNRSKDELELSEWDVETRGSIDASPSEAESDTKRNSEGEKCVAMVRVLLVVPLLVAFVAYLSTKIPCRATTKEEQRPHGSRQPPLSLHGFRALVMGFDSCSSFDGTHAKRKGSASILSTVETESSVVGPGWTRPGVAGEISGRDPEQNATRRNKGSLTSNVCLLGGLRTLQVRLKSLKSEVSTHITFVNTTGKEIRILWINFEGDEVAYNVILPGEKRRQQTFVTHPWIFRDLETHERLMADGRSAFCAMEHREAMVYIEHVPRLQWDPKAHHLYPQDFKDRARTVLMCHYRLQDRGKEEKEESTSSFSKYFSELPADILLKLLEHSSPRGIPDTRWIKPCLLPEKPPEDCISTYVDRGGGVTSCSTTHGQTVTAR